MTFADYVPVLKGNFKRTISNEELCGILFDAIITLADVRNRKGEIFTVYTTDISRILNRKKNIPKALQNHAWDESVQNGIDEYFETKIVAELIPDTSDLFYQLMKLIEADENISPIHKDELRNTGEESIGSFLKEIFLYTLRQENKSSQKTSTVKPKRNVKNDYKPVNRQNRVGFFNFPAGYLAALQQAEALQKTMAVYNLPALQKEMAIYNSPYFQTISRALQSFRW